MANVNINELTPAIGITGAEYVPCTQDGTTKRFGLGLILGASASGTTQSANTFLAGPASGSATTPSFRAIVATDVPLATISSILDNIGGTQGNVLFRGATQWQALAPSTSGYVLSTQGAGANPQWIPNTAGSVTSVGLALPVSVFSVTNSPVTSTGTLTGSFVSQSANTVFAGPTTGAAATPAFRALVNSDISAIGVALTKTDDTNVTLTLGGSPTTALLNATSLTLGWTGQLSLTRGGTAANLTASNGGIVYSTASAMAILSGTATAGQVLRSGSSAAPSWSTSTFPATTSAGTVLVSATANTITATATPTLGVAGTTVGSVAFANATSGSITLSPTTGALGTSVLTLPAATDTLIGKATTDTLTNKTFDTAGTGNSFLIAGVAVTANTGTGAVARATSPTFTTPTLGAATATTLNGNTFTTGTYTLTGTAAKTLTFQNSLTLSGTDGKSLVLTNGLTVSGNDGTLSFGAATKTLTINNSLAFSGTDSTTMTFPATSSTVLTTGNNATITKGYYVTPNNIGTVSSGTTTPDAANGNYQYYTNNGAHTLAAPSSDCAIDLLVTNGGSAGAITFSGFTVGASTGSALTTTNTNKFIISIRRINGTSTYSIYALQ